MNIASFICWCLILGVFNNLYERDFSHYEFQINNVNQLVSDDSGDRNITIRVNEIMVLNSEGKCDEFDEYNDWFEIYNYGSQSVNWTDFIFQMILIFL